MIRTLLPSVADNAVGAPVIRNVEKSGPGRVLDRAEAMAFAEKLLGWVKHRCPGVTITHEATTIVKVANNRVLNTTDGDTITIGFGSKIGSGITCWIQTNQFNEDTLRAVLAEAERTATPLPAPEWETPDDPNDPTYWMYNKRAHLPVDLWRDSTAHAMEGSYGGVVNSLIDKAASEHVQAAVTVGFFARSQVIMYKQGLTAYARETDCEVTMTARQSNGTASGWAGQANRDWSKITPSVVAERAIEISNRSKDTVALEPGRRTAILSSAAVAQLLAKMPELWDAFQTNAGNLPFSYRDDKGRKSRLFMKVVDERLNFISDPQDPEGGFPPFYDGGDQSGLPVPKVNWITNGVLTDLAYDSGYGSRLGKIWNDKPESVRVQGSDPTQAATVEEMIANCPDGVFVNRLSGIDLVDYQSGIMTGYTRDGCFHIKNGKINKPIKNFRFAESPIFVFNKLLMLGKPERVALGYSPGYGRWLHLPIICPPMMVQDFNFSGLSDAV